MCFKAEIFKAAAKYATKFDSKFFVSVLSIRSVVYCTSLAFNINIL